MKKGSADKEARRKERLEKRKKTEKLKKEGQTEKALLAIISPMMPLIWFAILFIPFVYAANYFGEKFDIGFLKDISKMLSREFWGSPLSSIIVNAIFIMVLVYFLALLVMFLMKKAGSKK